MAESQGNGLKTAANGLFHKNFEFGPLFWYDNFQNEIDTWETTVQLLRFKKVSTFLFKFPQNLALLMVINLSFKGTVSFIRRGQLQSDTVRFIRRAQTNPGARVR